MMKSAQAARPTWMGVLAWAMAWVFMLGVAGETARAQISPFPLPAGQAAGGASSREEIVRPQLVWSANHVMTGGQVVLAVVIDMAEHYHINPNVEQILPAYKEMLIPLTIEAVRLPEGVVVGQPQYPKAGEVVFGLGEAAEKIPGYSQRVVVYLPVSVDAGYQGDALAFDVHVGYQTCNDTTCLAPVIRTFKAALPVKQAIIGQSERQREGQQSQDVAASVVETDMTEAQRAALFAGFDPSAFSSLAPPETVAFNLFDYNWRVNVGTAIGLLLIGVLGLVGGLLLNFTPCVLPVIPIKILSLKQAAGGHGRRIVLGAAMSLGVIAFWAALGAVMAISVGLATKRGDDASEAAFTATNQLFQYPWFTIGVGVLIVILAVGMCGLFSVRLPQWVYRINPGHDSVHGSFGFGVMTAVLSTPCTAPFMGSAAGWAVTQQPWVTVSVFLCIGLGMALPYMLLSANPAWIDRLPRTGPGSELIKQVMGLLLLAAGAFFIGTGVSGWLVDPPQPPSRMYWWLVAFFVALAGIWLAYKVLRVSKANATKAVFVPVGMLMVALAIWGGVTLTDKGPIDWQYYTPQVLQQARDDGKIVVLEFTAEWCLNCKAMERSVLASDRVAKALGSREVQPIKIDLTGNNMAGNRLLKQFDEVAIPLLVVMTPDGKIVLKSAFYTVEQVLEAVREAGGLTTTAAH